MFYERLKRILSQALLALPPVKRIERRARRNNCLICPSACRCPNHSRLIHKMQAWMSEGLLRWGGAFQRLWTAVPPVITTLNLAGHSSAPLIEHLNLTRCYCHVLTNGQMPCYPPPLPPLPPIMGYFFFTAQSCMAASDSGNKGKGGELEGYCLLNKSNNSTSLDGYITRGQLVSCHVLPESHFGGTRFTFPMWFPTATTLPRPWFCLWHQGSPWGNLRPDPC